MTPAMVQAHPLRRGLRSRIGLVIFGGAAGLLLAEGGVRINDFVRAPPDNHGWAEGQVRSPEHWAVYDPDLGYRQNPKFPDMNSDGLRDHPIRSKAGRFRVLVLGDSVAVFGDSVDDTFVAHLRQSLQRDEGYPDIDVINAGVRGYTNYQETMYLRKFGVAFEPNLVGFEFCLNDLFKFLHSFALEHGRLVPGSYQFSTEAIVENAAASPWRWMVRSYLLVLLRNRLTIARNQAALHANRGFSFDYRSDLRTAWLDEPWQDIERQLADSAALGRDRGFGLFLVAFPIGAQYNAEYLTRDRDYVLKPQHRLRVICERLQIPFLDLYSALSPSAFRDGIHLTGPGRQLAGERIASFLSASGLLAH